MVKAILHMICGNCGSNDDFKYEIDYNPNWATDQQGNREYEVIISCGGCSTLHWLQNNAQQTYE